MEHAGATTRMVQDPAPDHPVPGSHSAALGPLQKSTNWAGYVETGTTFRQVSASWKVPAIPAASPTAASQWVGIDGVTNSDLIQTGTSEVDLSGTVVYFAWFEILPSAAVMLTSVPIAPGNQISAAVAAPPSGSGNWTISLRDLTSGTSATESVAYGGPGTSAEWIVEDPTINDAQPPLADFASTTFSGVAAKTASPSAVVTTPIELVRTNKTVAASPGALESNSFTVTFDSSGAPPPPPPTRTPSPPPACPTTAGARLGSAVGIAAVRVTGCLGYYVVNAAGIVSTFGVAPFRGDLRGLRLNAPIIAMATTPDGGGYWLLGADGGIFSFGDARFFGSTGNLRLNAPVVSMAPTADGHGYWLVAKDGGIFSFGDAAFHGSTGNLKLNKPVDGMAVGAGGRGYWLVAADGGVFAFNVPFVGSLGATHLNRPIVGMSSNQTGTGYTLVASDGGVFSFNAPFFGSLGANPPASPIVDLSPVPGNTGYYLLDAAGQVFAFGSARVFG